MSTFWKVMVGLLLTVPLAAYVTGTLVSAQSQMPAERSPIVITGSPTDRPTSSPEATTSTVPTRKPTRGNDNRGPDGDDDKSGRGNGDGPEIVRPTPDDYDDDDDDDHDDDSRDGGDDDD